eukprot:12452248-Alexandrium_andersonii.AAC.1
MVRAGVAYLGYKRVILKRVQEPSLEALKEVAKREDQWDVQLEESPVGESKSNGVIERAAQDGQAQVRTLRDALEGRCGEILSSDLRLIPWV